MAEPVSVILPTFNRANLLGQSIDALLAQTRPVDEILVADDGSQDGTGDVVRRYGDKVRYFRKENGGKAHTLNVALTMISHPLVWIMDDDDLALPHALELLTRLIATKPDAVLSYGRFRRFNADPTTGEPILGPTGYWRPVDDDAFLVTTMEDFFVHPPGMLVRRSAYDITGPFDVERTFSEDYDMLLRLARIGPVVGSDEVIFLQRQHDGARGPANARVTADDRMKKWVEHDQAIFLKFFDELRLDEYLPRGHPLETDHDLRRAHLQRACVMARKKLWDHALADFNTAAAMDLGPFNATEKLIVRRSLAGKYHCTEVLTDRNLQQRIQALKRVRPNGAAIVSLFSRGLVWRINEAAHHGLYARASHFATMAARFAMP